MREEGSSATDFITDVTDLTDVEVRGERFEGRGAGSGLLMVEVDRLLLNLLLGDRLNYL
ncbi:MULTISPECIES: hypothetical protein [unclassified Microcoleus]|uniref:hypothetical protein n=1 Tax=unclassified Microcoleus TaxID=2642155 RepID=UPI0025F6A17E|nr:MULTISPECIES: hypothetical protein [unclassified Microcoleus]